MKQHVSSVAVVMGSLVYMLVSAIAYQPWWELAFRSDASPVSWLSSALLLSAAILGLRLMAEGGLSVAMGSGLSISMLALALDEQFMFHERLKHVHLQPGSIFADATSYLIAGCGLIFFVLFYRSVCKRSARIWMICAIVVGQLALLIDVAPSIFPEIVQMLEEAAEVLAEALFVAALLQIDSAKPS